MEGFAKIVQTAFSHEPFFAKHSMFDVWQGSDTTLDIIS